MAGFVHKFYTLGYNILAVDARAHGDSEGTKIGMGWPERMDIIKWINLILSWEPNARIVLHGVSMGAATVLMASGEDLPGNVKAVIATPHRYCQRFVTGMISSRPAPLRR